MTWKLNFTKPKKKNRKPKKPIFLLSLRTEKRAGKGQRRPPPPAAPPASLYTSTSPSPSGDEQTITENAAKVNCLAFNPFNEWLVATGSTDETVKLFDLRKISTALHTFDRHKEEVFQVGWSPKNETVLASCCLGWKLMVWVLSRIDEERISEDAKDGLPELLFIHGRHTSKISNFSWNPCEDWVVVSVAEDGRWQKTSTMMRMTYPETNQQKVPRDPKLEGVQSEATKRGQSRSI